MHCRGRRRRQRDPPTNRIPAAVASQRQQSQARAAGEQAGDREGHKSSCLKLALTLGIHSEIWGRGRGQVLGQPITTRLAQRRQLDWTIDSGWMESTLVFTRSQCSSPKTLNLQYYVGVVLPANGQTHNERPAQVNKQKNRAPQRGQLFFGIGWSHHNKKMGPPGD